MLPGIIVQNSLFTTLNTATGLSTDLDKGFANRLRALPIARFAPLAGRILADLAKQAWAIALLYAVGSVMGFRADTSPLAVLAGAGLVLVCSLAFAWALVWIGMVTANPEKVQIFGFVLIFPLTFTSGAFVRTATPPRQRADEPVNRVLVRDGAVDRPADQQHLLAQPERAQHRRRDGGRIGDRGEFGEPGPAGKGSSSRGGTGLNGVGFPALRLSNFSVHSACPENYSMSRGSSQHTGPWHRAHLAVFINREHKDSFVPRMHVRS